eukprot:CAMPEP_0197899520 /NCGR_PEP_ID=MMETSP1439-20131203/46717_1 /TAXON_ID=66791 /ORGANISM="Gonyaulax spinifera, Strain CCMP409" /LENGTH=214 /DNA_ID=CAMNT_0043520331 /DNA_START=36 /DNA_END=677 /DNA_ORIENTATION=+
MTASSGVRCAVCVMLLCAAAQLTSALDDDAEVLVQVAAISFQGGLQVPKAPRKVLSKKEADLPQLFKDRDLFHLRFQDPSGKEVRLTAKRTVPLANTFKLACERLDLDEQLATFMQKASNRTVRATDTIDGLTLTEDTIIKVRIPMTSQGPVDHRDDRLAFRRAKHQAKLSEFEDKRAKKTQERIRARERAARLAVKMQNEQKQVTDAVPAAPP